MADSTPRAIVVGAGPGGLATAVALGLVGFEVRLYERSTAAAVGAGLVVAPNAMRALRRLGLADRLARDAGPPPVSGEIRNARGRVLSTIDLVAVAERLGEPSLAIPRSLLQAVLSSALPDGAVRYRRECTGVAQDSTSAHVTLADGSTDTADLVVGADGIRSVVRAAIGGGRVVYTGSTSWRTLVPAAAAASVRPQTGFEMWGGGNRFGAGHLGEQVYCFATAPEPPGAHAPDGEGARLRRIFAGWASPVPELVAAFTDAAIIRTDLNRLADVDRWASGRLVVIGDAAHAMTPDLGQGACQALEDAVFLAAAVRGAADIPAALRAFEVRRRERPERIARQARSISRLVQSTSPVTGVIRDSIARFAPGSAATRRYLRLTDVDLPVLT